MLWWVIFWSLPDQSSNEWWNPWWFDFQSHLLSHSWRIFHSTGRTLSSFVERPTARVLFRSHRSSFPHCNLQDLPRGSTTMVGQQLSEFSYCREFLILSIEAQRILDVVFFIERWRGKCQKIKHCDYNQIIYPFSIVVCLLEVVVEYWPGVI